MNKNGKILAFITLLTVIFWVYNSHSLDTDLGWRLQTGTLIIKSGIPRLDPFSYTMPDYLWIEHSWFSDVIISGAYHYLGYTGLSLIFALFTVASIIVSFSIFSDRLKDLRPEEFFAKPFNIYLIAPLLVLASVSLLRFSGIRAQVVTWLFMSIILKIIFDRENWQKLRWCLPPLFLVWVNLHGGFAAGLSVLIFVQALRLLKNRKRDLWDFFILLLSFLSTLINPYGVLIYKEVWQTLINASAHKDIIEWNSLIRFFDFSSVIFIAFSVCLVTLSRKYLSLEEFSVYIILLFAAFLSVRQTPLWILIALPYTAFALILFFRKIRKSAISLIRFREVYRFFYLLVIISSFLEIGLLMRTSLFASADKFYPEGAVVYIRKEIPSGEIFSEYDWGGYLIWKLPEKRVFIDGRMPFWINRDITPYSKSVLDEYLGILNGQTDYKKVFEKYNITRVLIKVKRIDRSENYKDSNLNLKLYNFLTKVSLSGRSRFDFIGELEKDGWKKVYQDKTSVIYSSGI